MKKWVIIKRVKDDIPGFRSKDEFEMGSFCSEDEAKEALEKYENTSEPHEGFGAGSGSIETTYYILEK